ncbi:MAG: hypothetical protein ACRDH2_03400 [Anaerolineales bacterium]
MFKCTPLSLGLLAFSLVLAACSPAAVNFQTPTPEPALTPAVEPTDAPTPVASGGDEVGGYADLVDRLRKGGATVEPGEKVEQPFFEVPGQIIRVNGAEVQVFEFADEAAREAASSQITKGGQPGNTMIINWIARPNFWAKGRVIVLYLGEAANVIARLTEAMGEPLTEPAPIGRTYPEAVLAAIRTLADATGISAEQISVVSFEAVQWPNSCLGITQAGIACMQVITPGYRIVLSAGGAEYVFHTNADGSAIRQAG